jgi:hypothetical protein
LTKLPYARPGLPARNAVLGRAVGWFGQLIL